MLHVNLHFLCRKRKEKQLQRLASCQTYKKELSETPFLRSSCCMLFGFKSMAFKCLCNTNDSITPPFKCASRDSVMLPEREERMKLTSANSLCPRPLYYDFLLKPYLSYNEFSSSTREASLHLPKLIFVCVQVNSQMKDLLMVWPQM